MRICGLEQFQKFLLSVLGDTQRGGDLLRRHGLSSASHCEAEFHVEFLGARVMFVDELGHSGVVFGVELVSLFLNVFDHRHRFDLGGVRGEELLLCGVECFLRDLSHAQ